MLIIEAKHLFSCSLLNETVKVCAIIYWSAFKKNQIIYYHSKASGAAMFTNFKVEVRLCSSLHFRPLFSFHANTAAVYTRDAS